ncbi:MULTISPECIES: FadR/GntR family transcriptional regulator [unclassified Brevundimonas]|uniref:FadR/GntR family transcriptional regulator n=1 Tax=unclassified Brevundimonas TaxID=2622653 RepID=UPI0014318216|nr:MULTISPECIES: FCD domain-containing protein [unclassified Brevundimonas]
MLKPDPAPAGRSVSMPSRIVTRVLDDLFAGKLKPGDFLGTEAQMVETFQASRAPVREALGRLEALGVVRVKTGVGGGASIAVGEPGRFATALAVQFILLGVSAEEVFDARIAVEARAAELAAMHASPEDLMKLQGLLADIRASGEAGRNPIGLILDYHMAIVEASGARTLIALMQAISHALLNLYRASSYPSGTAGADTGYQSLGEILKRIETRDAPGAGRAMHEHLLRQRDAVTQNR